MKDLYFFFFKNLMGAKLRRSFRNTCNGDNSISTLNQHNSSYQQELSSTASQVPISSSYMEANFNNTAPNVVPPRKSVTLEEMMIQLELEEAKARKEKTTTNYRQNKNDNEDEGRLNIHHRMSCVNNADILRSARHALNQYPRFSLDGRDAMYRSSFHNNNLGRAIDGLKLGRILHLPQNVGGESVIWCKPGVVPKLMGLDAMPVPISKLYNNKSKHSKEKLCNAIRSQNLRRRVERNEFERRQRRQGIIDNAKVSCESLKKSDRRGRGGGSGGHGGGCSSHSCSSTGFCTMNPIAMEPVYGLGGPVSWPTTYNYT